MSNIKHYQISDWCMELKNAVLLSGRRKEHPAPPATRQFLILINRQPVSFPTISPPFPAHTHHHYPQFFHTDCDHLSFTFEVDRLARENGDERTVVDSTVHPVPVGLVMNVTPFISRDKEVILNVRPTISRILNFAEDPSPALAGQSQVRNLIPEIQVREMESLLRVQSGNVAIIGGLMQNKVDNRTTVIPGLGSLPVLGKLFSDETREIEKTELLIFLRPTVIDNSNHKINTGSTTDGSENPGVDLHLAPDNRTAQRIFKER